MLGEFGAMLFLGCFAIRKGELRATVDWGMFARPDRER
jgi:hypothetical protein